MVFGEVSFSCLGKSVMWNTPVLRSARQSVVIWHSSELQSVGTDQQSYWIKTSEGGAQPSAFWQTSQYLWHMPQSENHCSTPAVPRPGHVSDPPGGLVKPAKQIPTSCLSVPPPAYKVAFGDHCHKLQRTFQADVKTNTDNILLYITIQMDKPGAYKICSLSYFFSHFITSVK